jgi:hypothetical protein
MLSAIYLFQDVFGSYDFRVFPQFDNVAICILQITSNCGYSPNENTWLHKRSLLDEYTTYHLPDAFLPLLIC